MNKAFLYLCTLIALFITISGLVLVRHASELIFHLLFAPVTVYLLIATASQIINPRKTVSVSLTANNMAVVGIFFLMFVIIAAKLVSILKVPV
jgi:4-hydroxybenzoate polyprenyltransferase